MTEAMPAQAAHSAAAQGRAQVSAPQRVITVSNSARAGNGAVPQGHRTTASVTCTVAGCKQWATCCHSPVTLMAGDLSSTLEKCHCVHECFRCYSGKVLPLHTVFFVFWLLHGQWGEL